MRHLASIQEIINLTPIENADFIEVATVLGWSLIVKKREFKVRVYKSHNITELSFKCINNKYLLKCEE